MVSGRNSYLEQPVLLEGDPLRVVDKFTYWDSVLLSDGRMEQAITARLG